MSLALHGERSVPRSAAARLVDRFRPLPLTNHVALGTFCHVASALREAGLRRWTGPFDWIFSTPGLAAECIADGFAGFLAAGALRSVPHPELTNRARRQCRHLAYEARYGLPVMFNHHDPVSSAADRRALLRAVRRMRDVLGSARRNQFYQMSEVRWPDAEIAGLARLLGSGPSRNALVVITATGGAEARSCRVAPLEGLGCPALDVELRTLTRSNGVQFPDPGDELFLQARLRELAAAFEARAPRTLP